MSERTSFRRADGGNPALCGRAATHTGLPASFIFFTSASASDFGNWLSARGSTYTGLFSSASVTAPVPLAACAGPGAGAGGGDQDDGEREQ
ncbi:hypothetical protein [Streptomyces sp. NPDC056682]|uniref:hypothetical protein n=1 Tax=Streptomyces sp. NPDC056682 TaxID=3345909 RepID=UPI003699C10C